MKIIIFVWTRNVINYKTTDTYAFWGLGDIIRGIIRTYQICKKYNYKFIVDINTHEISNYLLVKEHNYTSNINYNNIEFTLEPENYIKKSSENIIYFLTNDNYIDKIDDDCKLFLKELFIPNDNFKNYINKKLINYNLDTELKNYSAIHFRLGDDFLIKKIDNISNTKSLKNYIDLFNKYKTEKHILFTDNNIFKNLLKNKYNAFTFNTKISHIGYINNENTIEDTLFEFFILLQVKEIKYYNTYSWISGFIKSANAINDVPLINMI